MLLQEKRFQLRNAEPRVDGLAFKRKHLLLGMKLEASICITHEPPPSNTHTDTHTNSTTTKHHELLLTEPVPRRNGSCLTICKQIVLMGKQEMSQKQCELSNSVNCFLRSSYGGSPAALSEVAHNICKQSQPIS